RLPNVSVREVNRTAIGACDRRERAQGTKRMMSEATRSVRRASLVTGQRGKRVHPFDRELADLERAQHGLIAISQLSDPGAWTRARIEHRVRGRRERPHRGVWASPSVEPTFRQHALAMVLAAGDNAFASHETAVALRALPLPGPALLEVT